MTGKQDWRDKDIDKTERYTPEPIVSACRRAMGGIDLDPASCDRANRVVRADRYYTFEQDGLGFPWKGRVFLNHPYGRGRNEAWMKKLFSEYEKGNIDRACVVSYAATSEAWFRPLLDHPQCFLYGRTNFIGPDGRTMKGNPRGSVVTYLSRDGSSLGFFEQFETLGAVKIRPEARNG